MWHPHHTAFSSSVSTSTAFHRATALSCRGPLSLSPACDRWLFMRWRPTPRRRRRHRRTQAAGDDETRPENSESVPVLLWVLLLEISVVSSALFLQMIVTWRLGDGHSCALIMRPLDTGYNTLRTLLISRKGPEESRSERIASRPEFTISSPSFKSETRTED